MYISKSEQIHELYLFPPYHHSFIFLFSHSFIHYPYSYVLAVFLTVLCLSYLM